MPLKSLAQASKLRETNPEVYKKLLKDTQNIKDLPMRLKKKTVSMSKQSFVKEHKHLVEVLKSGTPAERLKEANEQAKELQKYL